MTDQAHYDVPLRWRDLNHLGHVYHATVLTLLDEARTRWLADVMRTANAVESGYTDSYAVARAEIDYRSPLVMTDGGIRVTFRLSRIGTTSPTLMEKAVSMASGAVVAQSTFVIVLWNVQHHCPRRPITPVERDHPRRSSSGPSGTAQGARRRHPEL